MLHAMLWNAMVWYDELDCMLGYEIPMLCYDISMLCNAIVYVVKDIIELTVLHKQIFDFLWFLHI